MFLGFFLYRKRETNEAWHHTLQKELLRLKKKVLNIWFEIVFHLGSVSRSESRGSHGSSRAGMCYSIWVLLVCKKGSWQAWQMEALWLVCCFLGPDSKLAKMCFKNVLLSSFLYHLSTLHLNLAQLDVILQDLSSITKGYLIYFSQFMNILDCNSPNLL